MVIVTGGAGFIGSAFIRKLNDVGVTDILVIDELGAAGKEENLSNKSFRDFVSKEKFRQLLEKNGLDPAQAIVHLGACSSTTETNAEFMFENNFRYSCLVAEWAVRNNARLIYASSAATYGDGAQGFDDDESHLLDLRPLNLYGFSKQLVDLRLKRTGLLDKVAGLKFFNVFGPNEYHKGEMRSVVLKAKEQIEREGKVRLFKSYRSEFKDGEQKRDFIYVKDCNEVMWWLMEHPEVNGLFNLGSGTSRSWKDLVSAVFRAMGCEPKIEFIDMPDAIRDKYQYFTEAKMEKLRLHGCPFKPTPLEDAVQDYVKTHLLGEPVY